MNLITMWDPTGMGACTMPGECVRHDSNGNLVAVGGNPGAANHPQHSCGCVVSGHSYAPAPKADPVPPIGYSGSLRVSVHNEIAVTTGVGCEGGCTGGLLGFFQHLTDAIGSCTLGRSCVSSMTGSLVHGFEQTIGGAKCRYNAARGEALCEQARSLATVWGPAFTLGDTITYDRDEQVTQSNLRHERAHVRQSDALGILYVPAYALSAIESYRISGANDCNIMEVAAGPGGGYDPCRF